MPKHKSDTPVCDMMENVIRQQMKIMKSGEGNIRDFILHSLSKSELDNVLEFIVSFRGPEASLK